MHNAAQRPVGVLVKIFPKLSETFILEELLGLERLGLGLRLYTLAAPTDALVHADVGRVRAPVMRVPALSLADAWRFAAAHLRLFASAPLRWLAAARAAGARGRCGRIDFVRAGWLAARMQRDGVCRLHAHFISTPADVAELASRLAALPLSISAHAKDIYLSPPEDLRRKLLAARFTVTCTEANRRLLASIAPQARIHRMYHGIDHARFHPALRMPAGDTPPLLLSVGRLKSKKGHDVLVEACALLRDRGERFACEIVGYGDEAPPLAARIARLGLGGFVRVTGKLARDDVIRRYAAAAVYVQPSRIAADGDRDGIPNVLLEAMAMGLPVVASRVSGIPELIEGGREGLLVEPDDPAALAEAIVRLLREPALCRALGERARRKVMSDFDNDRNLQLLAALLHDAGELAPRPAALGAAATE